MPPAHAVPARPRPHPALEAVPPPEGQDAGLHRPGRRPLPDADDAHARDDGDRARRRAGAAAERGSRRRRSGSATTWVIRRSGTRARRRSTRAARALRPGFRHNEESLRIARALNLTEEVCDGILTHTGPERAGDARGQDRPARRPRRLHQPRHRRRRALRRARPGRAAARRARAARARPARGGSTRSSTTSSRARSARATSSRARRSATRCSRCARSCSSASTSARTRAPSTSARARRCAGSSTTSSRAATTEDEIAEFVAGMTDRFALAYADGSLSGADQGALGRGGQGGGRHRRGRLRAHAAAPRRRALHRALPLPRGADAELLGQSRTTSSSTASAAARAATRSRSSRRSRRSTSSGRSSGSPTASASRSSTRSRRRARGGAPARGKRLHELLEQATAFYERHLWESPAGEPVRRLPGGPRAPRAGLPRVPARALARRRRSRARRSRRASRGTSCRAAGLTNRRGQRLLPAAADVPARRRARPDRRLPGAQAPRGRPAAREVRQLARDASSSTSRRSSTGSTSPRTAIAKQERAVVVEGNTDVIALRQAGFEPVVASMGTALTERQLKELQRLTRRLYLCFDGDAAGEAATLRGMELATTLGLRRPRRRRCRRGTTRPTRPTGFEERLAGSRELRRSTASGSSSSGRADRQEAFVRVREVLCAHRGLARAAGRAAARSPTGSTCRRRRCRASRRRAACAR